MIPPYPDPRHYLEVIQLETKPVTIPDFQGTLTLGSGLFDSGIVFAGTEVVASMDDAAQARFVRAVLTIDPDQRVLSAARHE